MKNAKLVSSLVLILSLTACGGPESGGSDPVVSCKTAAQLSAWSACQPDGTQTRTVIGGDCPNFQALKQGCPYCPLNQPAVCTVDGTATACCPSGALTYCPSHNTCYNGTPTAAQCGEHAPVQCAVP